MNTIKKTNRPLKKANHKTKIITLYPKKREEIKTAKLITALWKTVHAALWFNEEFTAKEKETFENLIAGHFPSGKDSKINFKELIERICLAKRYVARKNTRYISKPQDWLNVHYPAGLAGTAIWLNKVNEMRANVPDYNKGIATLADGILKFVESPNKNTFQKYRALLLEQKQYNLLQIFNNTIINLQYAI